MAPPQSEVARRLFRALGRDPGPPVVAAAEVVVVRVADDAVSAAYAKYLRAVDAANAARLNNNAAARN